MDGAALRAGRRRSLVTAIREAPVDEACADVAGRLVKGQAAAGSVWDAVHLAGAELQMRVPKSRRINGIHTVTSANGLHHCYLAASDPRTRHLILLQAVGWMAQFRTQIEAAKDAPRSLNITSLEPAPEAANPIAALSSNLDSAATQVIRLAAGVDARQSFQSGGGSAHARESGRSALLQIPCVADRRRALSQRSVAASPACRDGLLSKRI
jgi:hypothetical protein